MKTTRARLLSFAFLLVALTAHAQTPDSSTKHFSKDGLIFDYPAAWTLTDQSNGDAQQLTLELSGSDAQIKIFVHRGRVDTPDKMAKAQSAIIDPYVASTKNTFVQMGAKPEQSPAHTEVAGAQADGVRLRAVLGGDPGEAAIYWLTIGNRLAMLTFFGPDEALKKATPAWDVVRNSLHVEETKPQKNSTPKP